MEVNFIRPCYTRFYQAHKKEINKALDSCLSRGELTLRKELWDFERAVADFVGTKYAIGVNSGTDALFLSLKALGIGPGDEVITVSNTFIATIQGIIHCGATPVLVDVGEDELMNMEEVAYRINEKTRAIIPVQYTGAVCNMESLKAIVEKQREVFGYKEIYIVDDACQALGATYKGQKVGNLAILNCFSFNTAKLLGGICDGGMVTTNDKALAEEIALLRNHYNIHQLSVDRNDFPQPDVMNWAFKSRLSNVNAAFLSVKFKTIDNILSKRKDVAVAYQHGLSDIADLILPEHFTGRVWQEYHVRYKDREKLVKFLKERGIETLTRDTTPNHKMKGLGLASYNLPVTEKLASEVFRLPLHEWLTDKEINYVIRTIREYFKA